MLKLSTMNYAFVSLQMSESKPEMKIIVSCSELERQQNPSLSGKMNCTSQLKQESGGGSDFL
jgi:hypothetical protein